MAFEDKDNHLDQTDNNQQSPEQKNALDFQKIPVDEYAQFSQELDANIKNLSTPKQINFGKQLMQLRKQEAEYQKVNNIPDRLNKNGAAFNEFLAGNAKAKESKDSQEKPKDLGAMFEATSAGVKEMLFKQISTTLSKDPYLAENGKLTPTGEIVKADIEKSLTKNRMDNMSFALLDKLVNNMNSKLSQTNNKEQQLNDKLTLLMTMQNVMKNGGLNDLNKMPKELVAATDISWAALQNFQKNFDGFITARLLEAGFDRTSKETRRQSIIEQSTYSKLRLAVDPKARDKSVIDVVPGAFDKAFAFFDNQENSQKFVNALVGTTNGAIDFATLNTDIKSEKSLPADADINRLTTNLNNLIADIPKDMNSPEGKMLKEKVANNKLDKMLDSFGSFKEVVLDIIQWISNAPMGKNILAFFGKSFGLDSADVDRLLNRPYVKQGVDHYLVSMKDSKKLADPVYAGKHMELKENGIDWDVKTTYYKNSKDVVMLKEGDNRTCKKLDNDNKLVALDKTIDADLYDMYMTEKNGSVVAKMTIQEFIGQDLNTTLINESVRMIYEKKFGVKLDQNKKYFSEKELLQDILKKNDYIYSTADLIGKLSEDAFPSITANAELYEKEQQQTPVPPVAKVETPTPPANQKKEESKPAKPATTPPTVAKK